MIPREERACWNREAAETSALAEATLAVEANATLALEKEASAAAPVPEKAGAVVVRVRLGIVEINR